MDEVKSRVPGMASSRAGTRGIICGIYANRTGRLISSGDCAADVGVRMMSRSFRQHSNDNVENGLFFDTAVSLNL